MRLLRLVVLAAACALPNAAPCQPAPAQVRPGAMLDMTFVHPRIDTVAIVAEHLGDTVPVGLAELEIRIDSAGGAPRVVHIQRLLIGEEPPVVSDSLHAHWGTLIPISAHTRGDVKRDYFFGPAGVRVIFHPDSTVHDAPLAEPVYYVGIDLLLRALPLAPGYRAVLPVLGEQGESGELHVSVTGEEEVRTLDGGSCRALVVEVLDRSNAGTFRLSTATRAVVRFDSEWATIVRPTGCR